MKKFVLLGLFSFCCAHGATIKHDMGSITIHKIPQRVIVNSEEVAEQLAVLGIQPVGYASGRIPGQLGKPATQLTTPAAAALKGVPYIGTFMQPNREQIASLKPDLILLTVMDGMKALHNDMSKLAPTISYNPDRTPWRTSLLQLGNVLGREAKAKAFLNRYDERIKQLRENMPPDVLAHPRTTLLYMYEPNKAFLLGNKANFARQVKQLNLKVVTPHGISPDINFQEISTEVLTALDTDRILVIRKTVNGKGVPNNELDTILKRAGKPVLEYPLDPQEADGGPLSDLKRLPEIAARLK